MPVYNQEIFVAESITSVLKQTEPDFELIIVDDGSTDGSTEICEFYRDTDERIKFIRCKKNSGQAFATNIAAKQASGEYFAWHHSDDNYHPNFLDLMLKQEADVVFSAYQIVHGNGTLGLCPYDLNRLTYSYEKLKKKCYLFAGAMIYKSDLYHKVGGYDTKVKCVVDWDFTLKICADKETSVAVLPRVLVDYRSVHQNSNRIRLDEKIRIKERAYIRETYS